MTPDLYWVPGPWQGRLAVASRPRGGDWLPDEAAGWRRAAIDIVVSLLEREEAAELQLASEPKAVESEGMDFISFPIPDRGVPASMLPALSLLRRIVAALGQGRTVVVHCRQGIGRSGLMAAGTLVTSGVSPEKALATVSAARGATVPETQAQRDWLYHLPSELPVTTAS